MHGTSQTAKIGLDARAAELKEKLLKGRSQNHTRSHPPQPSTDAVKTSSTNPAAVTPTRTASWGSASSERTMPSSASFVPHDAPLPAATPSLPADANDIAALISSISSAAGDIPGLGVNGMSNNITQKPQAKQAVASEMPSLPPKPPPEIPIPPPTPTTVTPQSKQSQQANSCVLAPAKTPSTPVNRPVIGSSLGEGELTSSSRPAAKSTDPKSPVATTAPHSNGPQSAAASSSRQQSAREETDPMPTKAPARYVPCLDSGNKSYTAAPKPVIKSSGSEGPPKAINGSSGPGQVADRGKSTSQDVSEPGRTSKPVPSDEPLARLLSEVPDLKDWLEMTEYFNAETRTRKLDRFRRVKALAAEKLRIEEEERKLMAEEELEMGIQRSAVARLTSAVPSAPTGSETNSLLTTVTFVPTGETKDTPRIVPAKRSHDEDSPKVRPEKLPRLGSPPRLEDTVDKSGEGDRQKGHRGLHGEPHPDKVYPRSQVASRGSSPHRRPHPLSPRHGYHRSPPPRSREYSPHRQAYPGPRSRTEYDDYEGRHRNQDRYYKGESSHYPDSTRRRDSGQPVTYPVRVDLGRKGDTRFFIVKSFNSENVRACMEDDLWTTQVQNGQILTEAFAKCKNVILFFSINKSRAFQGYARMASAPSPDTPRPKWLNGIHWDTSDPFRVQWLSKTTVEFYRIGHLKNPYNENLPVLVGKDGQEIEEECGAELLREMETFALESGHGGRSEGFETHRGKAGWGYGHHDNRGPIKREPSPGRR